MPIYEYRCGACEAMLETMHGINEPPLTDCEACGKSALKRLISNTSFVLKGTGWYQSDYGTKATPSTGETSSSEKADSASTSSDSPATSATSATPAATSSSDD